MKRNIQVILATLGVVLVTAPAAFAQSTTTTTPTTGRQALTTVSAVIAKGDADIAKRLTTLTNFKTRIGNMKHLSDTDKATISGNVQSSIDALNALKTKLDADTDLTTAKTDYQSIYKDNRIYVVVMPQERTTALADAEAGIIAARQGTLAKIQTRIDAAKAAGKDTTAIQAAFDDANAKLADAQTQVSAAVTAGTTLQVDHGDKTILAANKAADTTIHTAFKTIRSDLKTAYADAKTVKSGLKSLGQ